MHCFEVVFYPHETRVYLFGPTRLPLSAKAVGGEVVMQVRDNPQSFRYPLIHVPQPVRSAEQDYLVAQVDVTRVRGGDMHATFTLWNLPYKQEPQVRFTQVFMVTPAREPTHQPARSPQIAVSYAISSDDPAIRAQGTCPVTDQPLGVHGPPIKVVIDGRPLFVCCKDCLSRIEANLEFYVTKVAREGQPRQFAAGIARPSNAGSVVNDSLEQPLQFEPLQFEVGDKRPGWSVTMDAPLLGPRSAGVSGRIGAGCSCRRN